MLNIFNWSVRHTVMGIVLLAIIPSCAVIIYSGYAQSSHLTGNTESRFVQAAEKLEKEGINVELVDLRTISPIDKKTILNSVAKTNRLAIAHEAVKQGGVGGEIAAIVAEEGLDYLDAPILRIGAPFTPIPFAKPLEQAYRVTADKIYEGVKSMM